MLVSEVPVLEIICSLSACVSVYLYGNGSLKAPLFGICSQLFLVGMDDTRGSILYDDAQRGNDINTY